MRTGVTARERERAERATLVQQEKLSKAKVGVPILRDLITRSGYMAILLLVLRTNRPPTSHLSVTLRFLRALLQAGRHVIVQPFHCVRHQSWRTAVFPVES